MSAPVASNVEGVKVGIVVLVDIRGHSPTLAPACAPIPNTCGTSL